MAYTQINFFRVHTLISIFSKYTQPYYLTVQNVLQGGITMAKKSKKSSIALVVIVIIAAVLAAILIPL